MDIICRNVGQILYVLHLNQMFLQVMTCKITYDYTQRNRWKLDVIQSKGREHGAEFVEHGLDNVSGCVHDFPLRRGQQSGENLSLIENAPRPQKVNDLLCWLLFAKLRLRGWCL